MLKYRILYLGDFVISIVAAMTTNRVIARDGRLPWHIPEETELYRSITKDGTVIVGRRTFQGLSDAEMGRHCIVLSKTLERVDGARICKDLDSAIDAAIGMGDEIYIIGGASVYAEAIKRADRMYISYIKKDYEGDLFFPKFSNKEWRVEKRVEYTEFEHVVYRRINQPEIPTD